MSPAQRALLAEHVADASALLAAIRRSEVVPLGPAALGRIATAPRRALVDVPSADNSQMDGYAVAGADLTAAGQEVQLAPAAMIAAGSGIGRLEPGTAAAIMTGAPVPEGADQIVPVEEAADGRFAAEGEAVRLTPTVIESGRFVRRRGSDTEAGDTVLREGDVLTPARISHLAACGITDVDVAAPVRCAVISTGSEVTDPAGGDLAPGAAFDANGPGLAAALTAAGAEVVRIAVVPDDAEELLAVVQSAVREDGAELIVTSGGVSKGAMEPVRHAAEHPEAELTFTAIAMQPGGPQGIGTVSVNGARVPWIAVPGNPVSALMSCEVILRPALGAAPRQRMCLPVVLDAPEASPAGKDQYRRARILTDGRLRFVGGPSSHLIGGMARCDALALVPIGVESVNDGDLLETILLPAGLL